MTKPWEMDWKPARSAQEPTKPWEMDWKPAPAKREYEGFEAPVAAVKNLVPSLKNFAGGVAQAIVHPVESLNTLNDTVNGAVLNLLPKQLHWLATYDLAAFKNRAHSDPQIRKMMDTANKIGGLYKDRYGTPKDIERTFAEDPVGFAADLSSVISGAGFAAKMAGATRAAKALNVAADLTNPMTVNTVVGGALKKTGNALSKSGAKGLGNVAGGVGNTLNWLGPKKPMDLAAEATGAGVAVVKNALAPKERAWLTALEGEGHSVVNRAKELMKNGGVEIVPGSKPSLSEAVSDLKLTKLAQFDQAAKKHLSTQSARRQMMNEAAQMENIGIIAKDEGSMKFAKQERSDKADPLYERAKAKVVDADEGLANLLGRPSMDEVMARAKRIAREEGRDFQIGETLPEHTIESKVLDAKGNPIEIKIPAQFAKFSGETLHDIKMGFDDLINDPQKFPPGIKSKELSAIKDTRKAFLAWVEQTDKIPDYKHARVTYEQHSQPIERMLIGQELKDALAPVYGEDAAALRSTTYENALKNAPRTAQKATGRVIDKLEQSLTPEEIDIVNNVRDDLRRSKLNERLAKFGRGNDPDLKKMASNSVGDATPPPLFNPVVTAAKSLFEGLKGKLDQRLALRVATELIAEDLNVPVSAIEKALSHEIDVKTVQAKVEFAGKRVGKALRTPAVYNALSPNNQQNRNALNE